MNKIIKKTTTFIMITSMLITPANVYARQQARMLNPNDVEDLRLCYKSAVINFGRENYLTANDTPQYNNRYTVMNDKFRSIMIELSKCDTDYQKIEYIITWLANNTAYDWGNRGTENVEAYACFLDGIDCKCDAYARAFTELCEAIGIPCLKINGLSFGLGSSPYGDSHAWNRVKLDNKWYDIDVTWAVQDKQAYTSNNNKDNWKQWVLRGSNDQQFADMHKPENIQDVVHVEGLLTSLDRFPLATNNYNPNNTFNTVIPYISPWYLAEVTDGKYLNKYPSELRVKNGVSTVIGSIQNPVYVGYTQNISNMFEVLPSTAVNKNLVFKSDDPNVTVDSNGNIKVVKGKYVKWKKYTTSYDWSWVEDPVVNDATITVICQDLSYNYATVTENDYNNYNDWYEVHKNGNGVYDQKQTITVWYSAKPTDTTPITHTDTPIPNPSPTPTDTEPEFVSQIGIGANKAEVNYKQKINISAPKKQKIKVTSSNKKVATASYNRSKGLITITGKSTGNCTITVKKGNITEYIDVKAVATTTKLKLPKKSTVKVGKTKKITISVTPKKNITKEEPTIAVDNTDIVSYTYDSNKNKILITGLQSGETTLRVTVGSKEATMPIRVK